MARSHVGDPALCGAWFFLLSSDFTSRLFTPQLIHLSDPRRLAVSSINPSVMPRELPGFYWDAEKNRYFPLSHRPASPSRASSSSVPLVHTRPTQNQILGTSVPQSSRSERHQVTPSTSRPVKRRKVDLQPRASQVSNRLRSVQSYAQQLRASQ